MNTGAVNRFFILPIFVLLGLTIPWEGWLDLGWAGPLLALAVLLLRRLPAVLALKPLLGRVGKARDALFLGWFGPIRVAVLFYANFSVSEAGVEEAWVIGSLIICASILLHGLSATPLTRGSTEDALRTTAPANRRARGGSRNNNLCSTSENLSSAHPGE